MCSSHNINKKKVHKQRHGLLPARAPKGEGEKDIPVHGLKKERKEKEEEKCHNSSIENSRTHPMVSMKKTEERTPGPHLS